MFNAIRAWLDGIISEVPPSSPLGKAMSYLDNQREALVSFCNDGRYGIDTNPVKIQSARSASGAGTSHPALK